MHAAGAFGRMNINNSDHNLEKLAANVRAATTTSASDRAKQIFVQAWSVLFCFLSCNCVLICIPLAPPPLRLSANYAPYPDGNVPRQGLYFSYRRVCDQYGIPHINTATLGKAIRLCFPTIKTRRLGVRGNSKYHCELAQLFRTSFLFVDSRPQTAVSDQRPLASPSGCAIILPKPTLKPMRTATKTIKKARVVARVVLVMKRTTTIRRDPRLRLGPSAVLWSSRTKR
mgnify:CR=1 FL=1